MRQITVASQDIIIFWQPAAKCRIEAVSALDRFLVCIGSLEDDTA
jgi:hypothetical protein